MRSLLILIPYALYLWWVAANMSDQNLNIAAVVTFAVIAFLVWSLMGVKHKKCSKNTCPNCCAPLHPIRSQFVKMCGSCDYQEDWQLKPGQKPLVTNNRQKG